MATEAISRPSLKELLSYHGLKEADLESICSREVRNGVAMKLVDWKMVGYGFNFPREKLAAIDRENETEDQRKIALLDAWSKIEASRATYLGLARVLHQRDRNDLVEFLCEKVKEAAKTTTGVTVVTLREKCHSESRMNVSQTIERLENHFDDLHRKIMSELNVKENITAISILRALTMLPTRVRKEYETKIQEMLPILEERDTITKLFLRLSPLFTFIDYRLLEYLIFKFGSETLNEDMKSYVSSVQEFKRETTVGELMDHWPGDEPPDIDYIKLRIKFSDDPKTYTLEKLDHYRWRFFSRVGLSDFIHICILMSLDAGGSFFAEWMVPVVIAQELKQAIREIDEGFCETEHVLVISLDQELLYQSDAVSTLKVQSCDCPNQPVDSLPATLTTISDTEQHDKQMRETHLQLQGVVAEQDNEITRLSVEVNKSSMEVERLKATLDDLERGHFPTILELTSQLSQVAFSMGKIPTQENSSTGKTIDEISSKLEHLTHQLDIQVNRMKETLEMRRGSVCNDLLMTVEPSRQQHLSRWLLESKRPDIAPSDSGRASDTNTSVVSELPDLEDVEDPIRQNLTLIPAQTLSNNTHLDNLSVKRDS